MRPRPSTRSALLAFVTASAVLLSLTGCVYFANADREIAALRSFALQLDGVTAVDEASNRPTYVANPFSIDATAVALVTIEGDDWHDTLPAVADAVITWLATEQTNDLVTLTAGVRFPGGVIGLSDKEATSSRIELAEQLVADDRISHAAIGWNANDVAASNADAQVELERVPGATVSEVATDWLPGVQGFGPLHISVAFTAPEGSRVDATTLGERTIVVTPDLADLAGYLAWIDIVDETEGVAGWRADAEGITVAVHPAASLSGVEAQLRAAPGFDQAGILTLIQGDLTIVSDGSVSVARSLAELLAGDARFSEIAPGTDELSVEVTDIAAATDLLAIASTVDDSDDVLLTLRSAGPGNRLTLNDVSIADAREWVSALAELAAPITWDRVTIWERERVVLQFEGEFDTSNAFPMLEAIHDQAIALGSTVEFEARARDSFLLAQFVAKPQIARSDLWVGRNVEFERGHDELIEFWNSLG